MKNRSFQLFAIMIFIVITLCFVIGIMNIDAIMKMVHGEGVGKDDIEALGVFGDSAGLLNALFSSLAFGGVVLTIIWQVAENNKQRTDEHRIQFENVFFNMTNTLEHIVSELKVKRETDNGIFGGEFGLEFDVDWEPGTVLSSTGDKKDEKETEYVTGREVFKYLYEERSISIVSAIDKEGIKGFEKQMFGILDNYFRYLYRILKYIDDSKLISPSSKYQYAGILRAHLSYMELLLIYYNGLSEFGREKMKPLIERYHLLKNIREEKLHGLTKNAKIKFMDTKDLYDESAWKSDGRTVEVKKNKIEHFYFRIAYAIILALIFNTLLSEWWHYHVNVMWCDMTEVVVRGLVLISVAVSLFYYQVCDKGYHTYFISTRETGKLWERTWNSLKGNWTLPVFLFLTIVTTYTMISYQAVWYDTYTVYLDLSYLYFPLLADAFALIVNVTREANWEEKKVICKE